MFATRGTLSSMRHPICAWYNNSGSGYEEPEDPPKEEPKKPAEPPKPKEEKPDASQPKAGHALVIGRFMPPHAGHQYLFDVAGEIAQVTTVLARITPNDRIPGDLRLAWLNEMVRDRVGQLTGDVDLHVNSPAFWQTWSDVVSRALVALPDAPRVDLLVSSDREAWRLAELLGARHVCVDPERDAVSISATDIRRDPLRHWSFLPPPVRAHYAKRIVLIGPESSGKSTFARELAAALDTVHVPEQARLFAQRTGGMLRERDLTAIAVLQRATESAAARRANRFVICDTDALSLKLWGERLFGRTPEFDIHVPDLYLVTDTSIPFMGTANRDAPAARSTFAARCLAEANASGAPVVRLPSDPATRLKIALASLR